MLFDSTTIIMLFCPYRSMPGEQVNALIAVPSSQKKLM